MDMKTLRDNPIIVGNRVKSARMLSGHTRRSFSKVSNISMATLRTWEEPLEERSGLTLKGAERLVKALNACEIYCTTDWLLFGKSPGPKVVNVNQLLITDGDPVTWGEEEAILRDIESFKTNNPDPIIAVVSDESMLPLYAYGSYVGGSKKYGESVNDLIGLNCIIELKDKKVIRRISAIGANNRYTLTALNNDVVTKDLVITEVEIVAAAQIVWHRLRENRKTLCDIN